MTIFEAFWKDPLNVRLSCEEKSIWFYLAGDCPAVSGIYNRCIEEIALKAKVPIEKVWYLLLEKCDGIKGISYDAHNAVVFVHNIFKYPEGGRPERVAISIINDHKKTQKAKQLWNAFRTKNFEMIKKNPDLSSYFNCVDFGAPELIPEKIVAEKEEFIDYEVEIQRLLNRYTLELDEEKRKAVFQIYHRLCCKLGSYKRLKPRSRYRILKKLDNYPSEIIAEVFLKLKHQNYTERTVLKALRDRVASEFGVNFNYPKQVGRKRANDSR